MSVKGYHASRDRESRENIAEADRAQRDVESKRGFVSSVIGSVSSLMPKGKYNLNSGYSKGNSPAWYKKYADPELFAHLPTWIRTSVGDLGICTDKLDGANVSGVLKTTYGPDVNQSGELTSNGESLPRVVTHVYMPHIGVGTTGSGNYSNFPINKAMLMVITNLGKVNSRAIDPDISIPGLYFLAGTELYSFLSEFKEVIELCTYFNETDDNVARLLVEGKGWDYSMLISNIAQARKLYAIMREHLLSTVPMPDNLSLLARRIWLSSVIIKDVDNVKAPYIQFAPVAYGQLSSGGTGIYYTTFHTSGNVNLRQSTLRDIELWFNASIAAIGQDQEFNTFIANMRAAKVPFASLPTLEMTGINQYVISANDEIKLQISNILTLPASIGSPLCAPQYSGSQQSELNNFAVLQDATGNVYQSLSWKYPASQQPMIAADYAAVYKKYFETVAINRLNVLNSFIGWNTDKILLATRFRYKASTFLALDTDLNKHYISFIIESCGTEVVCGTRIGYNQASGASAMSYMFTANINVTGSISGDTVTLSVSDAQGTALNACFTASVDGYPMVSGIVLAQNFSLDTLTGTVTGSISMTNRFQADDYFVIPTESLKRINELCAISEYYLAATDFKM